MTRAGGVSRAPNTASTETQGAKNRKGESERARVAPTGKTPQRDGPEAGNLRTERRDRRTLKGTNQPHERCPPNLSAPKRGRFTGGPVTKVPQTPKLSKSPAHGAGAEAGAATERTMPTDA